MTITDILVGENTVLVKRDGRNDNLEFEKIDNNTLKGTPENIPESVRNQLVDKGFEFESQFPLTFDFYVNDEAAPYDYREVGDELQLDEDHELVNRIANYGYEIKLTMRVIDETTFEITHFDGHKLEEPISKTVSKSRF